MVNFQSYLVKMSLKLKNIRMFSLKLQLNRNELVKKNHIQNVTTPLLLLWSNAIKQ